MSPKVDSCTFTKGQSNTCETARVQNRESSASHVHENQNAGGCQIKKQRHALSLLYILNIFSFLLNSSWIRCRMIVFQRSCRTHLHMTHVDSQWCLQPSVQPLTLTSYGKPSVPLIIVTFSQGLFIPTPLIPLLTNTSSLLSVIHFSQMAATWYIYIYLSNQINSFRASFHFYKLLTYIFMFLCLLHAEFQIREVFRQKIVHPIRKTIVDNVEQ